MISVLFSTYANCQHIPTKKYKSEYNPYFKLQELNRGKSGETLKIKLEKLKSINKNNWTFSDSLTFSEIALLTGNIRLSQHYLEKLIYNHKIEPKSVHLLLISYYLDNDYTNGKHLINSHLTKLSPYSINSFVSKIFISKDSLITYKQKVDPIFNFQKLINSPIKKRASKFKDSIITPIKNLSKALEIYVMYIHKDDPNIALCFHELGILIENKVSLNQAYISYSIARMYDKKNRLILDDLQRIKLLHEKMNYNIPNFRKSFPRIEYWQFESDLLNEKIIQEKADTLPKIEPNLVGTSETLNTPFEKDIIIPIGFILIFLIIILFTTTRKH